MLRRDRAFSNVSQRHQLFQRRWLTSITTIKTLAIKNADSRCRLALDFLYAYLSFSVEALIEDENALKSRIWGLFWIIFFEKSLIPRILKLCRALKIAPRKAFVIPRIFVSCEHCYVEYFQGFDINNHQVTQIGALVVIIPETIYHLKNHQKF